MSSIAMMTTFIYQVIAAKRIIGPSAQLGNKPKHPFNHSIKQRIPRGPSIHEACTEAHTEVAYASFQVGAL